MENEKPEDRRIKSFIIRGGRLSDLQQRALEDFYDDHVISFTESPLNLKTEFEIPQKTIIEIGFGMGLTTAKIAADFPEINFIGIEVHRPGVGKLLSEIDIHQLKNLKIIEHDAVEVLEMMIEDGSIDGFHIFFPDPWPKKKHHKRRLIKQEFIELLTSKLKKGGYLYSVTDWVPYAQQMLEVYSGEKLLQNSFDEYADPITWRPRTRFESKGLVKDHEIRELWFTRK